MATNLALDDKLIAAAVKLGKHKTKRDAVTAALEDYVKKHRRLGILDLIGKVEYYDDYDYKALRKGKKAK
jgi:UDP-N-acetylmuramate-alanine ligase